MRGENESYEVCFADRALDDAEALRNTFPMNWGWLMRLEGQWNRFFMRPIA